MDTNPFNFCIYSESTYFSENFDILYIIVGGVQAEEPFNAAYTKIALSNHHFPP